MSIKYKKNPQFFWRTLKGLTPEQSLLSLAEKTPKGMRAWVVAFDGVHGEHKASKWSKPPSWLKSEYKPATKAQIDKVISGVSYKKNPVLSYQPDLFEEGDTPEFVPVDELTEEQLLSLPFKAYSEEEWEELPERIQVGIWMKDPTTKKIKRLDFEASGSPDFEDLPEVLQEFVYKNDKDSQRRIEHLAKVLADHVPSNDEDEILQYSEGMIDHYMSDDEWLWKEFSEELMEKLEEAYPDVEFDEEEVKQAAVDYGFNQDNFSFEVTGSDYGNFPAEAPGYYLSKDSLYYEFPYSKTGSSSSEIDPELMPDDEIEKALELAQEKNDRFDDYGISESDVKGMIHDKWGEVSSEPDYDSYSINMDPNWEEIVNDTAEHLDLEPGRVHYEEHPPEERILFSGRQIGSPDDIVETSRVTFPLGDTYYAVDLIPSELKKETKRGRNCVGREANGYPAALRAGRIRLLSIRPETEENVWKRTYLLELVLDEPDTTSTLEEIVERGGIDHVEQIKGYNNRIPGFDRGLYESGTAKWVSPAEAVALLNIVEEDLNVKRPKVGTDTGNYILPALQGRGRLGARQNPAERACPIETPQGERPYSFNTPTKN